MDIKSDQAPRPALILLHGSYQNRYFWYSPQGEGVATRLLDHFDVWLMEARGHGLSPVNQHYADNSLLDYARYDIPAVNAFVAEKTGTKPYWLGHNEGVTSLLFALASGSLLQESALAVIGLGSPWAVPGWMKLPFVGQLQKLLLRGYHRQSDRGPEPESAQLVAMHRAEQTLFASLGMSLGKDFWSQLGSSGIPLHWLGSEAEFVLQNKKLQRIIGENKSLSDKLNGMAGCLHLHASDEVDVVCQLLLARLNMECSSRGQDSDLLSAREATSTT
ncbi:alpha/beta hydrolase [Maricurvus nonylphenolicus]|uniref:alpha/beta hydrolase n=1 Tax=Maricurvus nonylphenolicus TaxID=1008307 RepID=UPI0036F2119A